MWTPTYHPYNSSKGAVVQCQTIRRPSNFKRLTNGQVYDHYHHVSYKFPDFASARRFLGTLPFAISMFRYSTKTCDQRLVYHRVYGGLRLLFGLEGWSYLVRGRGGLSWVKLYHPHQMSEGSEQYVLCTLPYIHLQSNFLADRKEFPSSKVLASPMEIFKFTVCAETTTT